MFDSWDNFLCTFSQPTPLVFLLFCQFGSKLGEENSCHTLDYCAPFGMCLEDIENVGYMLFLGEMEGWEVVFWVTMFRFGMIHLCAALCS